jgi:phosphate transport system substrate-binding protein
LEVLGGALSLDQLRWIYSNYNEALLEVYGWNPESLPNSDQDPTTHLWSELDPLCASQEILIGGPARATSGSNAFFSDMIFKGYDESFDLGRGESFLNATEYTDLSTFILEHNASIAYFGLSNVLAGLDQDLAKLVSIQMKNGEIIKPSAVAFEEGLYPLSRRLYMYLLEDEDSLAWTRPFFDFGFSAAGDTAVKSVGFWPIDEWEKILMATRIQSENGVAIEEIEKACGPSSSSSSENNIFAIAGSSTVFPVSQIWSQIYQIGCEVEFAVEGGGSSDGAGRVCGNPERGTPVKIGDMSRQWKESEAKVSSANGYVYNCVEPGDTDRSAIQIEVAIDGLTMAVQEGGTAWECIQLLGGLTIDQLRWIYSNYNDLTLEETGWDPESLKDSDYNSQTHLWSELDGRCARLEIRIAGADDQSGTYEYFLETVLQDHENGERFGLARPGFGYENSEDDEALVAYLQEFGEAISYFGYAYYYANQDLVSPVPIQNADGAYVVPDTDTVGDGSYNPLARRIYMNLLNDRDALKETVPFVKFGLNNPGLVQATGYVALPEKDVQIMLNRLNNAPYDGSGGDDSDGLSTGAIVGIVIGSTVGLCCLVYCLFKVMMGGSVDKGESPEQATSATSN